MLGTGKRKGLVICNCAVLRVWKFTFSVASLLQYIIVSWGVDCWYDFPQQMKLTAHCLQFLWNCVWSVLAWMQKWHYNFSQTSLHGVHVKQYITSREFQHNNEFSIVAVIVLLCILYFYLLGLKLAHVFVMVFLFLYDLFLNNVTAL